MVFSSRLTSSYVDNFFSLVTFSVSDKIAYVAGMKIAINRAVKIPIIHPYVPNSVSHNYTVSIPKIQSISSMNISSFTYTGYIGYINYTFESSIEKTLYEEKFILDTQNFHPNITYEYQIVDHKIGEQIYYKPQTFQIPSNLRFTYYLLPKYIHFEDMFSNYDSVLILKSRYSSFEFRDSIRHSFANVEYLRSCNYNVNVYFVCGISTNETINNMLIKEQEQYNDLIVLNIMDSYMNLTIKTLMTFDLYLASNAHQTLLLYGDDDICVNMKLILTNIYEYQFTKEFKTKPFLYAGRLMVANPTSSTYFLHSFSSRIFLTKFMFIHGPLTVFNFHAIDLIMKELNNRKYLCHVDDVQIGALATIKKIKCYSIPNMFINYSELVKNNSTVAKSGFSMTHYVKTSQQLYSICNDIYANKKI